MKKYMFGAAAAALLAFAATPASAQDTGNRWYAGAGYTQFDAGNVDVGGVTGRLGYRFSPYFGVEGEATFGIEDDTADFLGTPVDVELDEQFGAYAVGFLPLGEQFDLIGRVGYATIDASGSVGPFQAGVDDDGLGYGVGAQWRFSDNFALRGDATRFEGDGEDADAFSISAMMMF
jgi:outer membrane immunogenic protein